MSTPEAGPSTQSSRSLNRQDILEEEEYTVALSHIIARDFFPSLVHLDATNDYLDALRTEDASLINASVRRLQEIGSTPVASRQNAPWQTPSETPYGFAPSDTPVRSPHGRPPSKRPRYDTSMSLDMFQAKYTSEDNASFTQILDEENKQRKERWGWAWEAQRRVELQRDKMLEAREKSLLLQAPAAGVREKFVIEPPPVAGLITSGMEKESGQHIPQDNSKGKELMSVTTAPQAEDVVVDVLAPKKDTRAAGVDAWKFKTRNSLMFPPDADVSPYDPRSMPKPPAKGQVDPKVIKYGNTRLPEQDDTDRSQSLSAPSSPTRSRIGAAISGTPHRPRTPPHDNFTLVAHVPSPSATEMGPSTIKQLMTWGTLNATPRILSQSEDPADSLPPPNTFHIPAPSSREALSHRLSANAAKSLRTKAGLLGGSTPLLGRTPLSTPAKRSIKAGAMPPPNWTPRRADAPGSLTPAAKRLLDKTTMGSTAARRRTETMGGWGSRENRQEKDLHHVRWTPTPNAVQRK
ncbi:nuclear protein DGCR14 [Scleroderma yunnanense]